MSLLKSPTLKISITQQPLGTRGRLRALSWTRRSDRRGYAGSPRRRSLGTLNSISTPRFTVVVQPHAGTRSSTVTLTYVQGLPTQPTRDIRLDVADNHPVGANLGKMSCLADMSATCRRHSQCRRLLIPNLYRDFSQFWPFPLSSAFANYRILRFHHGARSQLHWACSENDVGTSNCPQTPIIRRVIQIAFHPLA